MNHFMNGFADELEKVSKTGEVRVHVDDTLPARSMTITRTRLRKGQQESRPTSGFLGAVTGMTAGGLLASKYGKSGKALKAAILGGGSLGGLAGVKSGKKGRPELRHRDIHHLGPQQTREFLKKLKAKAKAKGEQTKTAAFPQREQNSTPYDSAKSVGATMKKTQGKSAAKGLKGSQVQPSFGQSKQAPSPMTTPNHMVNG